jgi:hypothetical protein
MPVLAASVRLSLWGTLAFGGSVSAEEAVRRATPHATDHLGGAEVLRDWRAAGATLLVPCLPRPGRLHGMPSSSPEGLGGALDAHQCVVAVPIGGLLVPTVTRFGPAGDEGVLATWTAYPSGQVARHILEATDLGELAGSLATALADATQALEATGGVPWQGFTTGSATHLPGLPDGLAPRAVALVDRAARVALICADGLDSEASGAALDATTSARRAGLLRDLRHEAERALVGATTVAAMRLAGWCAD